MNHEYIFPYVEQLVKEYPRIESVWLMGSRANDSYREESDWDLLVFANKEVLDAMRQHRELKRERVDVLVVYDSINFEEPWPEVEENGRGAKGGRLSGSTPLAGSGIKPLKQKQGMRKVCKAVKLKEQLRKH